MGFLLALEAILRAAVTDHIQRSCHWDRHRLCCPSTVCRGNGGGCTGSDNQHDIPCFCCISTRHRIVASGIPEENRKLLRGATGDQSDINQNEGSPEGWSSRTITQRSPGYFGSPAMPNDKGPVPTALSTAALGNAPGAGHQVSPLCISTKDSSRNLRQRALWESSATASRTASGTCIMHCGVDERWWDVLGKGRDPWFDKESVQSQLATERIHLPILFSSDAHRRFSWHGGAPPCSRFLQLRQ